MTRQEEPESRSAGKKAEVAVMFGFDQLKSWVLPKRTPCAGAMYCVGMTVGNTDICVGMTVGNTDISPMIDAGSYPPKCSSAAFSLAKKEKARTGSRLLPGCTGGTWSMEPPVSTKSSGSGCGREPKLPGIGVPKPKMPLTPSKSGELQ
jgi:hypothetical protein